jgi:diguanylate cyclase (GGDEF)-like protein
MGSDPANHSTANQILFSMAAGKLNRVAHAAQGKLLFNLDIRVFESEVDPCCRFFETIRAIGLDPEKVFFEISERHELVDWDRSIQRPEENRALGFMKAVADIHLPVEKLLETYSIKGDAEGLIIVDNMQYVGLLNAQSLLRILNEKRVMDDRDQNPLSKMPGNTMIYRYVSKALEDASADHHLIYFDFDNFKAYNDTYGFRHGDRVILLFAGMLQAYSQSPGRFAGHIGGDDFFLGLRNAPLNQVEADMQDLVARFNRDVVSFYDAKDIENGYITAIGRDLSEARFPIITISTVILELPAAKSPGWSPDGITRRIAALKKDAKRSKSRTRIEVLHGYGLKPNRGSRPAAVQSSGAGWLSESTDRIPDAAPPRP